MHSLARAARSPWAAIIILILHLFALPGLARAQFADGAVAARAEAQSARVHPGDQFAIAVILDIQSPWHVWPSQRLGRVPAGLEGISPEWTRVGSGSDTRWAGTTTPLLPTVVNGLTLHADDAQWPQPHMVPIAGTQGLSYSDRTIVFVPVVVAPDAAPGTRTLSLGVYFQACDESMCFAPDTITVDVAVEVVARDVPIERVASPRFAGFDPTVFGRLGTESNSAPGPESATTPSARVPIDFLGYTFHVPPWMIWVIAFLAGVIMNLTPCVLPVVPIKVMSIQQHAKEPAKLAVFGVVYCLGIVALFGVLAILGAFFGQAWGQLNGYWWFSIPLALIVAAMGLGMMDLFAFRLPQSVYMLNPSGDSMAGNFMLGLLTAILSTPCTGPMLAAVLAWGATQPTFVGVISVLTMGAGMASPYALLIFFPGLVDRVPRSGPGSGLLKQVLGLLMLSVAVYILSFLTTAVWTWWFVGLFAAAAFVWMYVGGLRVLKGVNAKIIVTHGAILGLIVTGVMTRAMVGIGSPGGSRSGASGSAIAWRHFKGADEGSVGEAIDRALADGKVVVVDFTAKWCANCHVIEKNILNSGTSRALLTDPRVAPIKVDLTHSSYAEGWAVLQEFSGAASIPFLAVMGPERGRGQPITYASFFKPSDLEAAVRTASGGAVDLALGSSAGQVPPR
ncbi:MAG: protein-disulfide reductase DsbD family protein [Phycisphaerales bacterium]